MQGHRRRQATKKWTVTHVRQKGYGDTGSSAVLALLDPVQTLPALRRLVSDPAAPVTRPHPLLGPAPTVACLSEKTRQAPPGSPGKVQGRNIIGLFIIGQPRRHLQEISSCLPIGVAEEKRADRLDGVGNSAIDLAP